MKLEIRAKRAFEALEKIGAPVRHFDGGYGGNALFAISAEHNDREVWADYYMMSDGGGWDFGVNPKIEKVLEKYKLFAEWYNPGVLDVHDADWG